MAPKAAEEAARLTTDGYIRGILGLPLTVDDAGLTRAELETKYRALLAQRAKDAMQRLGGHRG